MSKKNKPRPYECDRNGHDFMIAVAVQKDGSTSPMLGCRLCGDVRYCQHDEVRAQRGTK